MTPTAGCRATLAATLLAASGLVTEAQQTVQPRLVEDVVLSAKTPLGEASITLPAGAEVTDFVEEGDNVRLRQGPFTATVPRAQLTFGPVVAAAPETTPAENAPVPAAPAAEPVPDTTATAEAFFPPRENILAEWKTSLPIIAAAVLALYALFTTLALRRLKRRGAKEASAGRPALPAVVTGGGTSIACPLCGKDIAVKKLKSGRNNCPVCRGAFVAERP